MSIDVTLTVEADAGGATPETFVLFDTNMTHNVIPMWQEAGCYDALYNSDGKQAGEIVAELRGAALEMLNNPAKYKALNPPNGWGDYRTAFEFLWGLLTKCEDYPKATIHVSK